MLMLMCLIVEGGEGWERVREGEEAGLRERVVVHKADCELGPPAFVINLYFCAS